MEQIVNELTSLAERLRLVDHALSGFRECFANEGGKKDGYGADDFKIVFRSHSLTFHQPDWSYGPCLRTYMELYKDTDELKQFQVGYYELITSLTGAPIDDVLSFSDM